MAELKAKVGGIEYLTLHVGPASFLPVVGEQDEGQVVLRRPGPELLTYDQDLLERLIAAKASGKNIVAVGTTCVRALESMAVLFYNQVCHQREEVLPTQLFIQPGYHFQVVDRLITNFHQSGSSHLLLVEAFVGTKKLERIYQHALARKYRFLSYGDGMVA